MSELVYEEPVEYSRTAAAELFASGDTEAISSLMIGLAYHDGDWAWVLDRCVELGSSEQAQLRYISALCVLHLARIHGELDLPRARPLLLSLETDPEEYVREIAKDAIEEVGLFLNIDLRDASIFN